MPPRAAAPYFCSQRLIEKFILSKEEWLIQKISLLKEVLPFKSKSNVDYRESKKQALLLIEDRLTFFNHHYGFKFKKITIRNQSTRWGSCSKRGNLNLLVLCYLGILFLFNMSMFFFNNIMCIP